MSTLFELDQKYLEIANKIEQNEGELTEELEGEFDFICFDLMTKMENYLKIIDSLDSQVELGKKILERIQKRTKSIERQKERLKQNLITHMVNTEKEKIETDYGTIRLQYSNKVKDMPLSEFPNEFIRTKIIQEIDKINLKTACKNNPEMEIKYIERSPFLKIY